jgi:hypothetical protein
MFHFKILVLSNCFKLFIWKPSSSDRPWKLNFEIQFSLKDNFFKHCHDVLSYLSCPGLPVFFIMSKVTCQADLFRPTCLGPVPVVLCQMSCPECPVMVILSLLFLLGLPCSSCCPCCHVAALSSFSCSGLFPGCPVRLSCLWCLAPGILSTALLFLLSCHPVMFWSLCPLCPV